MRLEISGVGNVVAFKNTKSIFRTKDGRRFIATNPKYKKWMEKVTQSIASQLYSYFRTNEGGISTGVRLPSWIALTIPLDDSWQWIPELNVRAIMAEKGNEGAVITIERIT